MPSLDRDGTLYFVSDRDYAKTLAAIYRGRFATGPVWPVEIVAGVSQRQPGIVNFDAEISGEGSALYFVDGDFRSPSPPKSAQIVIARRRGGEFVRLPRSREIFKQMNISNALQYAPAVSEDELEIFFTRFNPNTRPLKP